MYIEYKKLDKVMERLAEKREENRITPEMIMDLHDVVIKEYGGTNGLRDSNLFESICVNPYQNVFGQELYPTIFDKAAKLLFDFSNYQVFMDGNKRTGVLAMSQELLINGFDLDMPDEQIYFLTIDIATHNITEIPDIAKIIKNYCKFTEYDEINNEIGENNKFNKDIEDI